MFGMDFGYTLELVLGIVIVGGASLLVIIRRVNPSTRWPS